MGSILDRIGNFIGSFPEFIEQNASNPLLWIGIVVVLLLFFLIGVNYLGEK